MDDTVPETRSPRVLTNSWGHLDVEGGPGFLGQFVYDPTQAAGRENFHGFRRSGHGRHGPARDREA